MIGRGSGNNNNRYNIPRNDRRDPVEPPHRVSNGQNAPMGQRHGSGYVRGTGQRATSGSSAGYGRGTGYARGTGQRASSESSARYNNGTGYARGTGQRPVSGSSASYGRGTGYARGARQRESLGNPAGYGRNSNNAASYGRGAVYGRQSYDRLDVEAERRRIEYMNRRAAEERRRAEYARRRAEMEREMRRLEQKLKAERRARRKRARKLFYGRAMVCLCVFAVLLTFTGAAFAYHFYRAPDDPLSGKITYKYGGKTVRECDASFAVRGGETYLCFDDVADYLNMAVTGDSGGMKFILKEDGTDDDSAVEFIVGSRTAFVCGRQVTMSGECFLSDERLWVPASFAGECLRGIDVAEDGKSVNVARLADEEKSTEKDIVYKEVSLLLGDDSAMPSLYGEGQGEKIDFLSDLSEYEKFMAPEEYSEYLILVNSSSPLDKDYAPDDLTGVVNTREDERETQQLRLYAAKALEALFVEMKAAGIDNMSVTSGYRSYQSQTNLFSSYAGEELASDPSITWEEAERRASIYSSRPGTSEHQSGLCADMHNLAYADAAFAETSAYRWLRENAWKFGFVLRYPEGKTEITGITFEPWHWRYVGRTAALEIYNSGMCLEEYLASRG